MKSFLKLRCSAASRNQKKTTPDFTDFTVGTPGWFKVQGSMLEENRREHARKRPSSQTQSNPVKPKRKFDRRFDRKTVPF
jgi:hypothetical protein